MRYKYRNKVTGAEFESNCEISAPNWEKVGAEAPVLPEDPEPEIVLPDPEEDESDLSDFDDIIKPDEPQEQPKEKPKAVKKTAKKPAKKGAKK